MNILIENVNVLDVKNKKIINNIDVLVKEDKIAAIGKDLSAPDCFIINGLNKTLIPGMIDAHVHLGSSCTVDFMERMKDPGEVVALRAISNAEKTLKAGVTGVRNAGEKNHIDTFVRDSIEKGENLGPTIIACGRGISIVGGHGYPGIRTINGEDDARGAVREHVEAKVNQIKVIASGGVLTKGTIIGLSQMTMNEMKAITSEAKAFGLTTMAHAHGTQAIRNCIEAKIDSIEHCSLPDEESLRLMAEKGIFMVPTFAASEMIERNGTKAGFAEEVIKKSQLIKEDKKRLFKLALDIGVNIAMGTDAGSPLNYHGENAVEIELMVKYGMKPMDALIAATYNGARVCRIDNFVGSIEVDKIADLVLINGNPIDDVKILQNQDNILMVLKKGKIVKYGKN